MNELKAKLEQLVNWTMQPDAKALQEEIKTAFSASAEAGAPSIVGGPNALKGSDLKWADWKAKRKVLLDVPSKPDQAQRRRDLFSSSLHVRLAPPLPRESIG